MKKLLILLLAITFQAEIITAQKINKLYQGDSMTHVFKLNYEQSKFLLSKGTIVDTNFLFTKKFREYPRSKFNTDTLPDGNFIIASINDYTITYSYYVSTPFEISSKVISDDEIFFLRLSKNKSLIKNARLELDGKQVPYDEGYGGFTINKTSINQSKKLIFLKVAYEGETYVFKYSFNDAGIEPKQSNYYNNRQLELNSPGYILLDKPIYKPLESINLKAYLINYKNGNPIRKQATLSIKNANQNFSFVKKIKRKSPGAFVYNWQIPDTLKLDQTYDVNLRFIKKGRSFVKSTSFKLAEYELNKNVYAFELPNTLFYAGDDINFYATAKDMNGFPVQGTRISINLRIDEVMELFTDSLTISNAKMKSWYTMDTLIEYENFIHLKIPSNELPKINAKYTIEATFTDPQTFEKKAYTKSFTKYTEKEKLVFYQFEDSVHVQNLYNLKDAKKPYYFISLSGSDTFYKQKIITPFHYKLSPLETSIILIDKDSMQTSLPIKYNKLEMCKVKGKRSGDSISISFSYPFKEPVHFKIYKKDRVVKSGMTNELKFSALDNTLDEYKIILSTNLQNTIENNFYEIKFVPEKNLIHFAKKIPESALPGDSIAIEIIAMDFKNKPLKKINMATYSINAAFEDQITPPYIELPLNYQDKISIKAVNSRDIINLSKTASANSTTLTNEHFERFNLRKNEYYQLKYPLNELTELKIKKQQASAEFALFITHKNNLYSPKYISIDGQPIFISDINESKTYSFEVPLGKHDVLFRYFDKTYELKNLNFESNTKHLFGINYDSIKAKGSRFIISDSLSLLEPTEKEKEILYASLLVTNTFPADSTEILSKNLNHHQRYLNNYQIPVLNIDGDNYYVQGPFHANQTIDIKIDKKSFPVKPGINHVYHYDAILKDLVSKPLVPIKGAFLHFRENTLAVSSFNALLQADTLLPQPIQAKIKYKPETAIAQAVKEEESFYQNYRSQKGGNAFQINIKNNTDTNYIKSMWIISKSNFEACDFIQTISKPNFSFTKRSVEEIFDIYLFYNNNKMCILKNQTHENDDAFFINASLLKTEEFNQNKIETPLKIYAELNQVPLVPFNDAPFETKDKIKTIKSSTRNTIYFHGRIGTETQEPVQGAFVYAEINGRFKYGATTNQNGLFEIVDMIPGSYQIKIYSPDYKITHFETMLFEGKTEYELSTNLRETNLFSPLFESIQNDFRFQAFTKQTQNEIIKVNIYEKENRNRIDNVRLELSTENKIIAAYNISSNAFDIPFPKNKEKIYDITLSKAGYTSLLLHQIQFKENYTFQLDAFMGLMQKEIVKQKEFNLGMENQLPEYEDETQPIIEVYINDQNKAGDQSCEIFGQVFDIYDQALDFVTIVASTKGITKGGSKTDLNGNYKIKPLAPGTYDIKVSYAGYMDQIVSGVNLQPDSRIKIDFKLEKKTMNLSKENSVKVIAYKQPLISAEGPVRSISRQEIKMTANNNSFNSIELGSSDSYNATAPISFGGDRASSSIYMIDGVPVRIRNGNAGLNIPTSSIDQLDLIGNGMSAKFGNAAGSIYAESSMIDDVMTNNNASSIRKKFSDIGFWQPNLITNKKGMIAFKTKLPDNITSWKTYLVGAGKHWKHGIDSSLIKVYKPLQSTVIVPNYFYKQDHVLSKIRFTNLTKDELMINTIIKINNVEKTNKSVSIKNTAIDSLWLDANNADSMAFEGGLVYKERYKDFEHFDIPILSTDFKFHSNQSLLMEKDSSYTVNFEPNTKGNIIFNNSLYEKILHTINELSKYEFGCVEQTASKLSALISKDRIEKKLAIKGSNNKEINAMIAKLNDMQNADGSFGWWRKNGTNHRMTLYALDVTGEALRYGYMNNTFNAALNYVQQHYAEMSISDKLYANAIGLATGKTVSYKPENFDKLDISNLSNTDKIYYYQNKIAKNEEVNKADLYAVFLEMNQRMGKRYYDNFFYDNKSDLFISYKLFKNTAYAKEFTTLFRKKLLAGQYENNLNTFSKAKMIDALVSDVMNDTSKPIQATLTINDTLRISNFPSQISITASSYKIKHIGGEVFLNTSEEKNIANPNIHDSVFSIKTHFQQNQQNVKQIKQGKDCEFVIHIQSYKQGEHVMLEIPIPSGMKIKQKNTDVGYGNYVEFYKHKVVYFFDKLPMGTKQISIPMTPIFNGKFTLPAAKISLMYYPFVFGNNENSIIEIK